MGAQMAHVVAFLKGLGSYWPPGILDWLDALPDWSKDGKWIQIALLIAIVHLLSRQRARLQDTVNLIESRLITLRKLVEAVRDDTETVTEPAPPATNGSTAGPDHWETVRRTWASARNRIELAIDEGVKDGRKRRRYANMSRYTYNDIIFALRSDGALKTETATRLIEMNALFLRLRARPRATTEAQANHFEALYRAASANLPKEAEPQLPLETQVSTTVELPSVPWGQQTRSSEAVGTVH
jgi:hypothetical protein